MFMVKHFPEDAHAMCMTNSQLQMQMVNASTFNGWPSSRSKYTKKKLVYGHNSTSPSYVCWFILPILEFAQLQAAILGAHISPLASHHIFSVRKQFESWTNKHQIAGSGPAHVILGWRSKGARQGDGRSPPKQTKKIQKECMQSCVMGCETSIYSLWRFGCKRNGWE